MLKILALQYELEEPLNLNGDMAEDLAEEAIQSLAHLRNEHTDAMRAMSLATKPRILAHKKHWDEDTFWDWIKEFWTPTQSSVPHIIFQITGGQWNGQVDGPRYRS
ncbi:hypothetical protein B0H19DRAFT_1265166 [Mycena capillaripes]|nr:hypothetical protein B0H19DRAFT_1265166 [Mycena capillaripes]